MDTFLEGDTRRSVKLADDDTLSPVNDERATLGHHRQLTHVNFFVLNVVFFA